MDRSKAELIHHIQERVVERLLINTGALERHQIGFDAYPPESRDVVEMVLWVTFEPDVGAGRAFPDRATVRGTITLLMLHSAYNPERILEECLIQMLVALREEAHKRGLLTGQEAPWYSSPWPDFLGGNESMASFKASAQTSGGLLDDRNVEFVKLECVLWDYDGNSDKEVPGVRATLQPYSDDWSEKDGEEQVQFWSAGDPSKIKPSKDGKTFDPVVKGAEANISKTSNFGLLVQSMVSAGFDDDKIDDDITVFEGLKAHVARKPQPKRRGLNNAKEDATFLGVVSIKRLPYEEEEAVPAKGKTAAAAKGGKSKGNPLQDKADETILEILKETDPIKKQKLSTAVFQKLKKDPEVKEVVELVSDDDYLGRNDAPFDFDGTSISSK